MNNKSLPDPIVVLDVLKRHAAGYKYGCWQHHDGEIYDKCPYLGSGQCVKDSNSDALAVFKILLTNQSESSPYYNVQLPSHI